MSEILDGPISQGVRDEILKSKLTPYALTKAVNVNGAAREIKLTSPQVYSFQSGKKGLGLPVLDEVARVLNVAVYKRDLYYEYINEYRSADIKLPRPHFGPCRSSDRPKVPPPPQPDLDPDLNHEGPISEGLRDVIAKSKMAPYALAQKLTVPGRDIKMTPPHLYNFLNEKKGLSLAVLDEIGRLLDIAIYDTYRFYHYSCEFRKDDIPSRRPWYGRHPTDVGFGRRPKRPPPPSPDDGEWYG